MLMPLPVSMNGVPGAVSVTLPPVVSATESRYEVVAPLVGRPLVIGPR